jgi:hypothetical protein
VAACALVLALVIGPAFNRADGASTSNLKQIRIKNDAFLNYDFTEENHSKNKVDWPITVVFWNGVDNVDDIKLLFRDRFHATGSPMNSYLNNGAGWKWDSDKGRKENLCSLGDSAHYRIYAPGGEDRFYNTAWGYYAIASTHFDHNECTGVNEWFGLSTKAEARLADEAENILGKRDVRRNSLAFGNAEPERVEGDHHWRNEGQATTIKIPPNCCGT